MPYRILLVDDEPLARSRMRKLLDEFRADIAIVGEATNGTEALALITELMPDVVFLDIQMPELSGFEVARQLATLPIQPSPIIVFVTAFDEYALQAFEQHAIDYLLKPVEPERLRVTIEKLKRYGKPSEKPFVDQTNALPFAVEQMLLSLQRPQPSYLRRLSVTLGERTLLLNVQQISHFAADNKYTIVHTDGKHYILDTSLTELERRLDPQTFVRIHRSTIVNLDFVKEIHKALGRSVVVLNDRTETHLDVGRTYAARVAEL